MNRGILPQKSCFFKVFKRIIFFSCLAAIGTSLSCRTADNDHRDRPENISIQERRRKAERGHEIALRCFADSLIVYKSKRTLSVFGKGKKVKTYIISLGTAPEEKKRKRDDYKTPEGVY